MKRFESTTPQDSIGIQPLVDLDEWYGTEAVDPSLSVPAFVDLPGLTQDTKVPRNTGASDGQSLGELSCSRFVIAQNLMNSAATRVGQYLDIAVHGFQRSERDA